MTLPFLDTSARAAGRPRAAAPPTVGRSAALPVAGADRMAAAILERDYLRGSTSTIDGRRGHKEWHHFCVQAPSLDLLANFSLSDDARPNAPAGAELARLSVLARARSWDGDVETFERRRVQVRSGRIAVAFGENSLAFRDGAYRLRFALGDRPIAADLTLRPLVLPTLAPNIPLPAGPPLHWVIVPRLVASGVVAIDGTEHRLRAALAYHDHNWGHFLWGHKFSWIWGFIHPIDPTVPWTIAFVRLMNRARTAALAQGLFVWRDAAASRIFRDAAVDVGIGSDWLRPAAVFKIPRVMALASPELVTDVPRTVEMRAAAGGDHLRFSCRGDELAQVVIPSETDLGVTIINEVTARFAVDGRLHGEPVAFEGRGFCEFLGC